MASRRLLLVRHGEAEMQAREGGDHARALTRRGGRQVVRTARRCVELGWQPELILVSTAVRTRQTADLLARELGLGAGKVRGSEGLYLADANDLLREVRAVGPRIQQLMLVGHNPGISQFAQLLAPQARLGQFDTAAVCALELELLDWSATAGSSAASARYEAPR